MPDLDSPSPSSADPLPRYHPASLEALKALLQEDHFGELERIHQTYGDIVQILLFGSKGVIVSRHPEHIAHVLLRNAGNYVKHTQNWKELRPIFGEGILTSEGEDWRWQRRIIQPV